MYKIRPFNVDLKMKNKTKGRSSTKRSTGLNDIMQMAEDLLNNNTALDIASNDSMSQRIYPMLSKKNTFNKKSGVKPVIDRSLSRNIGTNSSKSIARFANLDISASLLDTSSDNSFEQRMFTTNKKKSS
jgi:hypothetical protein